jgi:hypothetical protein
LTAFAFFPPIGHWASYAIFTARHRPTQLAIHRNYLYFRFIKNPNAPYRIRPVKPLELQLLWFPAFLRGGVDGAITAKSVA